MLSSDLPFFIGTDALAVALGGYRFGQTMRMTGPEQ